MERVERRRRFPKGTRIEMKEGTQVIVLPGPREDHDRVFIGKPVRKTMPMIGAREPVSPTETSPPASTTDRLPEPQEG